VGKEIEKTGGLSRRKFVKGAGVALAGGVVGGIMASQVVPIKAEAVEGIGKSGVIRWDPDRCTSCSRCLMACAVYHESAVAPQLSRVKWKEDDFLYGFRFRKPLFCNQCDQPECYYACPKKDKALCIDAGTGARYINRDECIGCGECVKACPFGVSRINFDEEMNKAIKCDLCKDRGGGPVCVEMCETGALAFVPKEGR
jgi:protein NrfC